MARQAIIDADVVIIGPGDYYASLMATLVPSGVASAFAASQARVVYILNLMTRITQNPDMPASELLAGIEAAIGKKVDTVISNNGAIEPLILDHYASEHEFPIVDDLRSDKRVIRADVVNQLEFQKAETDTTHRSLLRHDVYKLTQVFTDFLKL